MANVIVDQDACIGCGLCEQKCPEVFEMKDDGKAYVKTQESAGCDLNEVVDMCPVTAIKIS